MIFTFLRTLFTRPIGPIVLGELFRVSLLAYLLLLLIEYSVPGSVVYFVSMTTVLIIVLVSGVGAALCPEPRSVHAIKSRRPRTRDYVFIVALALIGATLIYTKTKSIGHIAIGIATLSGVIIALLSLLLLYDDGDEASGEYQTELRERD